MGLIVDLFAGGGGASTGIEWALGRSPDIAINHDPMALAMHAANHPTTKHLVENVWHVRPRDIVGDQPVDLLWASPDCTHFSKAKGAAPKRDINRAKRSRGLAWVILRWAREAKPTLILMENVEEWNEWGPIFEDGRPDPERKGETRQKFVRQLKKLGFQVVIIPKDRACDHGAPTIRQRLVMVARCDGLPIMLPEPSHAAIDKPRDLFGLKVQPYRTAAEIIDWSIPCPSIFTRKKPLASATNRRIARGMKRYVIDNARPYIVPVTHAGSDRVHPIDEPLRTITTAHRGELSLITPYLVGTAHGEDHKRGKGDWPMSEPLRTVTTSNGRAVVEPFLAGCGGRAAQSPERQIGKPLGTITAKADQIVVAPFITKFRKNNDGVPLTVPMPTITANSFVKRPGGGVPLGLAAAFMAKHYGGHETPGSSLNDPLSTVTTQDHNHLVAATLLHLRGSGERHGHRVNGPVPTLTAQGTHLGVAQAFLTKYYSQGGQAQSMQDPLHTVTTKARLSLVTTAAGTFPLTEDELIGARRVAQFMREHANDNGEYDGVDVVCAAGIPIVDIGMRMLDLRELYRAQGFPDSYIIYPKVWRIVRGKLVYGPLPKTDGTRMCGNSVSPYQARAWILANAPPEFYAPGYREDRRAA